MKFYNVVKAVLPFVNNYKKMAIISAIVAFSCSIFGFALFPKMMSSLIKKNLRLNPGTAIRKLWTKVPFYVDFKIYAFNVTNPDDVMAGKKPNVQQIGPYMFEEWKEKYDLVDNDEDDTVEFEMKNTFIFRPDLSGGLTGREVITIPHLLIMGGMIAVQREKESLIGLAIDAFAQIFAPTTGFLTASVMDILFNGIGIDCNHSEFEAQALCSLLDSEGKGIKTVNATYKTFSVFGTANGSSMGRFTVKRGNHNIKDLGSVVKFNGEEEQNIWDGDVCNQFDGTDSTIFPPYPTIDRGLVAFAPDLCRSLGTVYEHKDSYNGVPTGKFSMDFGDLRNTPDLQCFCRSPDTCPPKGTMDLMPCAGAPLIISKPQFYGADPSMLQDVSGLNPNKKDHDIFLHVEMMTGTPLSAAKRLQFALDMEPVERYPLLAKLPRAAVPLFWVEEAAHLERKLTNIFRYGLLGMFKFVGFIKWTGLTLGLFGMGVAGYMIKSDSQVILNKTSNVVPAYLESQNIPPLDGKDNNSEDVDKTNDTF